MENAGGNASSITRFAWWKEFVRVESGRLMLFALVLVLLYRDPGGDLLKMVLGALVMAIQNNRYSSHGSK